MAAKIGNGTLAASTVATETLTGWAPYIAVTISSSVSGVASVTIDGTTPVVNADDTYQVTSGTTVIIKNGTPKAGLPAPDGQGGLSTPSQASTTVKLISTSLLVYSVELVNDPGVNTVLL